MEQTVKQRLIDATCGKEMRSFEDETVVGHIDLPEIRKDSVIVNYPQAKDLWASDFTEECPFKRLGLLSSPSV